MSMRKFVMYKRVFEKEGDPFSSVYKKHVGDIELSFIPRVGDTIVNSFDEHYTVCEVIIPNYSVDFFEDITRRQITGKLTLDISKYPYYLEVEPRINHTENNISCPPVIFLPDKQ